RRPREVGRGAAGLHPEDQRDLRRAVCRSVRRDQRQLHRNVHAPLPRRNGGDAAARRERPSGVGGRDHRAAPRKTEPVDPAPFRRREGADCDLAPDGDLPFPAVAVLHSRRGGRAARRGEHRPLHTAAARDDRRHAVQRDHPQQADDGDRRRDVRRHHGRAGLLEGGLSPIRLNPKRYNSRSELTRMRVLRTLLILAAALRAARGAAFAQALPQHVEPGGVYTGDIHDDPLAAAALAALTGPSACAGGSAVGGMFACQGIDLQTFVRLADLVLGSRSASNLWGFVDLDDRREYAVIGVNNGTAIVEVADPAHARVVGSVPGPVSVWREVKVYQPWNAERQRHDAYAYVVSEATGAGLQIIDLSNLPSSVSLLSTFRGFDTAHTLFVANVDPSSGEPNVSDVAPVLYIEGSDIGFLALDITQPASPRIPGRLCHSPGHD